MDVNKYEAVKPQERLLWGATSGLQGSGLKQAGPLIEYIAKVWTFIGKDEDAFLQGRIINPNAFPGDFLEGILDKCADGIVIEMQFDRNGSPKEETIEYLKRGRSHGGFTHQEDADNFLRSGFLKLDGSVFNRLFGEYFKQNLPKDIKAQYFSGWKGEGIEPQGKSRAVGFTFKEIETLASD